MKTKTVILREKASQDVDQIIEYYLNEVSADVAEGFINDLERGARYIGRNPKTGSSRYSVELSWPDLLSWPLKKYPYMLFYLDKESQIEVIRVLHAERDLPYWLREG